jgi:hypothetical protein
LTESGFQSSASVQGQQFAAQCNVLLTGLGYQVGPRLLVPHVGIEIDAVATTRDGRTIWFEYKGSVQGRRPGLMRTDTLKKAIANGALLTAVPDHPPYVVLTSHLPAAGAGLAMLGTALTLGYFTDVVCIYDPSQTGRLAAL